MGGVPQGQLLRTVFSSHRAHDDQSRMDPHPKRQADPLLLY